MENITYILKEYLNYHDKYTEIYGQKTIVIMMCGQFYEIYGVNNDEIQVGPNLNELSDILNIAIARRNKNIPEISYDNYQMMGWPDHSLLKFQNILLNNGYTIVKVDQVTAPPNPERKVTEIISPSTCIESYDSQDTNYLASIYINTYSSVNGTKINVAGLSFIDVSTGKSFIHSISSSISDNKIWNDEIYRLIQYYNPRELVLHYNNELNFNKEDISKFWQINENNIHINLTKSSEYHKLSYQNKFLSKIFSDIGNLSPIEYLDLEREPEIVLSYIYMIQFIHEHKVENTLCLQKPEFKLNNKFLLLSHNCVEQLNVIDNRKYSNEKYNCLLNLINKCSTAIGRRLCKERLLYPILDVEILNKRYDIIELFQNEFENEKIYNICKSDLSKIIDIEKLHRKMSINILNPYDFYSLHISYQYIKRIFDKSFSIPDINNFMKHYELLSQDFNNLIKEYTEIFNINQLDKCTLLSMDYSVFNKGKYPEIDSYDKEILENKQKLKDISRKLGFYIDKKKDDTIKLSYNDRYGWHLYMTKNRSETLKQNLKNLVKKEIDFGWIKMDTDDIKTSLKGSNYHLDISIIHKISDKILSLQKKLQVINKEKYLYELEKFYTKNSIIMRDIVNFVGNYDLNSTISKISLENVYCKPRIINQEKSVFLAKNIRHPIVEKINDHVEFVPNDISLDENGILLYGTNACGKSTLMKSIGLSLIMAQSGFFVPCSELIYSPYTQIFTRILSNDNLFRGQSTFAVEMSELRGILLRSNKNSLVLGDEVCSGTENVSALSIVSAGLKKLSEIKCSFIFTSHLHQLMDIKIVNEIRNLDVFHLKIKYDIEKDLLIYDRKLEKGSGPPIYGLEVCKAMGLDTDFLKIARDVQLDITGTDKNFLKDKLSKYNSKVIMDQCGICSEKAEETHHINEQQIANKYGIINHYHKNNKHNLVPLCKKCHKDVTYNNLEIYGYSETDKGIQLNYKYTTINKSKKKYSQIEIDIIKQCWKDTKTKKECISKLDIENNIQISQNTFYKIINNFY